MRAAQEATITGVRIIGWIHLALGLLGLAAGLALWVGFAMSQDPRAPTTLGWVIPLFLIAAAVYLLPSVAGGAGLLFGQAWARVVIAAVSVLLLTFVPVGTVLGAISLWVLFGRGRAGKKPASITAGVMGLLVAMAGVAAGFVAFIGAGFRLNHEAAPAVIEAGFFPALLVLAAAITLGVIGWRRAPGRSPGLRPWKRAELKREQDARLAEHRRRLADLGADPARSKYVALIEGGQPWSDEHIAYDLDPAARVTCAHLRPIEDAMRKAGLRVRPSVAGHADVEAVIDPAELARLYADPQVAYSEFELGGRSYEDNPVAQIACAEHRSAIYAVHPREAKPHTPRFPAP